MGYLAGSSRINPASRATTSPPWPTSPLGFFGDELAEVGAWLTIAVARFAQREPHSRDAANYLGRTVRRQARSGLQIFPSQGARNMIMIRYDPFARRR
jgi:hypothetical protein